MTEWADCLHAVLVLWAVVVRRVLDERRCAQTLIQNPCDLGLPRVPTGTPFCAFD